VRLDAEAAVKHLRRSDPVMRSIVKAVGPLGLKPGSRGDNFTTIARAIVGQQLSAKAAETIWQRLLALHPNGKALNPEDIVAAADKAMRGAGLSAAKTLYLKDLAGRVVSGEVRLDRLSRMDDERIVAELTPVKGIGRWTVEMFLIFKLGRADVWPVDDLGIRNAVKRFYGLDPTKDNMQRVAEPWRPWRSAASWYLWRSLSLPPV
jgi:DNA-3-methyladenine glycosylase II